MNVRRALTGLLGLGLVAWTAAPVSAQELNDADLPFVERNGEKIPLFMHSETFANGTSGWARDEVEIEAAMTLSCINGTRLHTILSRRTNRNFRRARRVDELEAFTLGYDIDQIPWNRNSHRVREGLLTNGTRVVQPYVWLQIETGRFDVDEERNRRRLSFGTDIMDDIYYDTEGFLLLDKSMSIRARKRWDSPTEMRRLLVALKIESGVDAFGIKRAAKMDVRRDGPTPDAITSLDEGVTRGLSSWDNRPAPPLRRAYERLRPELKSSPTYTGVLALQPKAFLRSIRSRYHLNETRLSQVTALHNLGRQRLEALIAMAREARADGAIPAANEDAVRDFETKAQAVLDNTLVAERAAGALAPLGVANADVASITSLLPTSTATRRSTSLEDLAARRPFLEQRRVVAETVDTLFHELASDLDDGSSESIRRLITRASDRTLEDHVDWFVAWCKSVDLASGPIQTLDLFVTKHEGMLGDAQQLKAYNDYGEAQVQTDDDWEDFEPLTQSAFDDLRFQLRNEQVRIWIRQIEAAGSAVRGLWFEEARQFYVPRWGRQTGNFLIDTMDFTAMYTPDVWDGVDPAERNASVDLTAAPYRDKLIHATLVNEVQIELSAGAQMTARLKQLNSLITLPRFFMLWATDTNQASTPAEYRTLFEEMKALSNADLEPKLAELNAFMAENDAPASDFDANEFKNWIDPARLTAEVRDDTSYSEDAIDTALAGAQFIFEQYRDVLRFVSRIKGRRVRRVVRRDGGPACMEWVPSDDSKGRTALGHVKALGTPGDSGGIIGAMTNNHSQATAATVERRTYPDQRITTDVENWYQIELQAGESVTFQATFEHDDGDLDMYLYDENGDELALSENEGDEESITFTATNDMTVSMMIYGYDGAENTFRLRVR